MWHLPSRLSQFWPASVRLVLSAWEQILGLTPDAIGEVGRTIPIPRFDHETIDDVLKHATQMLQKQPTVLRVRAPIYVIGDIHGNILDLIRILITAEVPPKSRFLFLGDYVDRGQYSVEVMTLLFALQIAYPEHVLLIRGNHEFEAVNSFYGFQSECENRRNGKEIFEAFNSTFEYLPLAAIVNNSYFCVHGGLSPHLTSLRQLEEVQRPLRNYECNFVSDLVWSDPSTTHPGFVESQRGTGVTFGVDAVSEFLKSFAFRHIVRAHQCVQLGVATFDENRVYTVFSSSNYQDASGNRCGILFLQGDDKLQMFSLPPLDQIDRSVCLMVKHTLSEMQEEKRKHLVTMATKWADLTQPSKSASMGIVKLHVDTAPFFCCGRRSAPVLPPLNVPCQPSERDLQDAILSA